MTDIGRRSGIEPTAPNSYQVDHWADRRQFTCTTTAVTMAVVVWAVTGFAMAVIILR